MLEITLPPRVARLSFSLDTKFLVVGYQIDVLDTKFFVCRVIFQLTYPSELYL